MRAAPALVVAAGLLVGLVVASGPSASAMSGGEQRERDFAAASAESGVPEAVLKAVSYALTRWDDRDGEPTRYGGYGLMHLTDPTPRQPDGRGQAGVAPRLDPAPGLLRAAAELIDASPTEVRSDPGQNIRAGAALLAQYARQAGGGQLPPSTAGWSEAVARFGAGDNPATGAAFVEDVFALLRTGHTATVDGQRISLPADLELPVLPALLGEKPECPRDLDCRFVPAAYEQTDPSDPNAYGNYDPADRPGDGNDIRYILLHSTESTYSSTINAFGDPSHGASTHYVIRSEDGEITQMVHTDDLAFHAGNWTFNSQAIGIEHEGFVADGATWFTEEMYRSSARLVRYLAQRYDIPLDRRHILGSDEIQRGTPERVAGAHYDPATYWNWPHFMELLADPAGPAPDADSGIVTITPPFEGNEQPVRSCDPGGAGTPLPAQGTNFLYLRAAPSDDAPLIGDPVLHPDGGAGTTQICDWSSKALSGRSFALAATLGEWTAIWHGGTKGWFRDPTGTLTEPGTGLLVEPAPGLDSIPVYGLAYPEPAAFPSTIPVQPIQPLQYRIAAGQRYTATDVLPGQYYYARFDGAEVPDNHTLVLGERRYALINFNYRHAYVDLDDVRFVDPKN